MNVLEVRSVSKTFGKQKVLNDVSIDVPETGIFGLLGPNGAGKTTLIRIINQIIVSDEGEVKFLGNRIRREDISKIGYLPEERGLYSKMKVGEHLLYMAQLKGMTGKKAKEVIKVYLEEFDIFNWWYKKVEQLSKGMQQKLQFIIAIMHNPRLVILDEPFTGFDPVNIEIIKNKILQLKEQGTSFILSTHRMESVEELCDQIALINKANKILDGSKKDIKEKYKEDLYEVVCYDNANIEKLENETSLNITSVRKDGDGKVTIRIQLGLGSKINHVIAELLPRVEIYSVNEIIPSINDIFISLVNGKTDE